MIELITTSIFVFSSLYGSAVAADVGTSSTASSAPLISVNETQATATIPTPEQIEQEVKQYFKKDPILVDIARCESNFRQFKDDGYLYRGKVNHGDIGVMQINEYYHLEKAQSLGFDIKSVGGNLAYAQYLYDTQGVQPWMSSEPCWGQALKASSTNQVAMN